MFQVFTKGPSLYAFKGLAGRFAPIGVHIAMIFIMAGATLSATGSFKGSVDVPQGLNFVIGDVMKPKGVLSFAPDVFNTEVHVNRFYMEYYDSGEVVNFAQHFICLCDVRFTCGKYFWLSRFHNSIAIFHFSTLMAKRS